MHEEILDLSLLGITEKKRKQFAKKGIQNIRDLLLYFPRTYRTYPIVSSPEDGEVCFPMKVLDVRSGETLRNRVPYILVSGISGNCPVSVFWFRQSYRFPSLLEMRGSTVYVAGKASMEQGCCVISAPDLFQESNHINWEPSKDAFLFPVYSKIPGMSDDYLKDCVRRAWDDYSDILSSAFPKRLEKELCLPSFKEAVRMLHFPFSEEEARAARKRMDMEELFYFAFMMAASDKMREKAGFAEPKHAVQDALLSSLPYTLTKDQKDTVESLSRQMEKGEKVYAMIQGDVGCGKSVIAFLLAAKTAENGRQTALLAPTSVLAEQHCEDLKEMMMPVGIQVEYVPPLTSMKKKEKKELLERISSGEDQILVGTHSLLSPDISFQSLGLVIADEEHKFGVEQRAELLERTEEKVHYISMSATPIPRSLAGVIYGEAVQLYQIRTMPPGRKPVQTASVRHPETCFPFLEKQRKAGRQIYVVCPQIDGETENISSVKELTEVYRREFGEEAVCSLTGKNTKKETERILTDFQENRFPILIATTVIEVGVNVPNVSTIVIHNAERFGLASLHQLRGRVGRGGGDAYCILISAERNNPRIEAMCKTTDGFEIAEQDMKLRGAGDLFGTEQSGLNEYIERVKQYPEEYEKIREYIRITQRTLWVSRSIA